jgi:hypothetical protein
MDKGYLRLLMLTLVLIFLISGPVLRLFTSTLSLWIYLSLVWTATLILLFRQAYHLYKKR